MDVHLLSLRIERVGSLTASAEALSEQRAYRYALIHCLPHLWVLDEHFITSAERREANEFAAALSSGHAAATTANGAAEAARVIA